MAVAIDPFLYLAFALGVIGGRLRPVGPRWLDRATLGCVLVLIGFLGVSLGATPIGPLVDTVPVALGLTAIVLGVTLGVAWLLRSPGVPTITPSGGSSSRPWLGVLFLADVVLGYGVGHFVSNLGPLPLTLSLYLLLALVGWGLRWSSARLGRLWVPLSAAIVGALAGGIALFALHGTPFPIALATTFGFGFYTLAGPLVAYQAGATLGFLAFLSNFLRENLTMILSPWLGRHVRGEGLAAMGGATSMDTTLYFVTRFGDPDAGALALATGLILTLVATIALPLLLALPGG